MDFNFNSVYSKKFKKIFLKNGFKIHRDLLYKNLNWIIEYKPIKMIFYKKNL